VLSIGKYAFQKSISSDERSLARVHRSEHHAAAATMNPAHSYRGVLLDGNMLAPFQNLRLDGAGAVADSSRPANHSPAGVGQEAPVPSGAGAPIQPSGPFSMGDQPMAAAVMPPAGPPMRPRKPIKSDSG
jgi:hypothetical protein